MKTPASGEDLLQLSALRRMIEDGTARRLREDARLSITEIARAADVDPTTVARWENRERVPRGSRALRYKAVLHMLEKASLRELSNVAG